ncbi:MAG TPA: response regulator transcription factor [Caulobacteraceae bacterium]
MLVDDHAIVRDGLRRLLMVDDAHQIREAANGPEALSLAQSFYPDLVILDLNLPGLGGLELLRRLLQAGAGRILVLSMHAEPIYARRAMATGANGYLSKNASPDELLLAVRRVSTGGRYVEAEIAQALTLTDRPELETLDTLNPREIEIIRLLSNGSSLAEISAAIGISYKTVANNCSLIKAKLGVARTADLVRLAIDAGIT